MLSDKLDLSSQLMAVVINEGVAEFYYPSPVYPLQVGLPKIISLESLTPEGRAIVEALAKQLPITRFYPN
jgi:hypothetical protein